MKALTLRVVIVLIGAATTWFVLAISFDPFFVVGGTAPAIIWGAPISRWAVAIGSSILIGLAVYAVGKWQLTALCLCLWLAVLASTTHRLVEHSDGRVTDVWMGFALQRLPEAQPVESELPRCNVGRWLADCSTTMGERLLTGTPIPFDQLYPGSWAELNFQ